jgi:hypothetical protein
MASRTCVPLGERTPDASVHFVRRGRVRGKTGDEGGDGGVGILVVVEGNMEGEGGALHEAREELEGLVCRLLEKASRGRDNLPTHTKNLRVNAYSGFLVRQPEAPEPDVPER